MSQRDALRAFDASIFESARKEGLADGAIYQALGGPALSCTVMVDDGVDDFGDDAAPVSAGNTVLALQIAEAQPKAGAQITLPASLETFRLVRRIERDESGEVWEVQRG